jgi:hypothetical protein
MLKLKKFFCQFPNLWALRVSGMGGYSSKCEKSKNHCTLICSLIYHSLLSCTVCTYVRMNVCNRIVNGNVTFAR